MDYVRRCGYPVPAVEEISNDGMDLVIQRIEGVTMLAALGRQPWTVRHQGTVLADLHRRLHDIPAPDHLPGAPVGQGDRLVHLDLHPLNIIIGPAGPVVIDWPNAARGDPAVDVGVAWLLMAASDLPYEGAKGTVLRSARSLLVNSFLANVDLAGVKAHLRAIAEWKERDANLSAVEQREMWRVIESDGTKRRSLRGGRGGQRQ